MLRHVKPGDEIVIPLDVYGGTYRILNKVFQPIGCVIKRTTWASTALGGTPPKTKLVWID